MPKPRPPVLLQVGTISGHFDGDSVVIVFLRTEQEWNTPVFFDPPRFRRMLEEQRCTPAALVGRTACFDGRKLTISRGPDMVAPNYTPRTPRFPLGRRLATPAAAQAMEAAAQDPLELFRRHQFGDWGDLDAEDKQANEVGVRDGFRILSAYTLTTGVTLWVITEEDRSATTILLPDEN